MLIILILPCQCKTWVKRRMLQQRRLHLIHLCVPYAVFSTHNHEFFGSNQQKRVTDVQKRPFTNTMSQRKEFWNLLIDLIHRNYFNTGITLADTCKFHGFSFCSCLLHPLSWFGGFFKTKSLTVSKLTLYL